jgi:hypothetical protein
MAERESVVEQSSSHQEVVSGNVCVLLGFLLLPPFIPFGPPEYWMVLPTFKMGLPCLVNLVWKSLTDITRAVLY